MRASNRWRIAAKREPRPDPIVDALYALAESNARLAEAFVEAVAERDDERPADRYLDGSPM